MNLYEIELENFRKVSRAYNIQVKLYREGKISDETYLSVRKQLDDANKVLDKAEKEI